MKFQILEQNALLQTFSRGTGSKEQLALCASVILRSILLY